MGVGVFWAFLLPNQSHSFVISASKEHCLLLVFTSLNNSFLLSMNGTYDLCLTKKKKKKKKGKVIRYPSVLVMLYVVCLANKLALETHCWLDKLTMLGKFTW